MGEMLNDLIFSVNTILPVFIVVAIGYFMRRRGTVDEHFVGSISNVVFYYALPARMFLDVAGSDFTELMNPRFILVTVGGTIGVFLLAWLVISHCIHDGRKVAAAVHSAYRGNRIADHREYSSDRSCGLFCACADIYHAGLQYSGCSDSFYI